MRKKRNKEKRLIAVLMSLAIAVAFIPSIGMAANTKSSKDKKSMTTKSSRVHKFQKKDYNPDTGFNLVYEGHWDEGTEVDEFDVNGEDPPVYPVQDDCLTVTTDENVTTEYYFDEDEWDFYDSNGNEIPYYWGFSWDDDYSFAPGNEYGFSFYIEDDNEDVLAWSQSIYVLVTENMESTVINGILYRALDGSDKACVYWTENDNISGNITIPASVKMRNGRIYPITWIDEYAFENCKRITGVSLPNTIEKIGDYAFCDTGIKQIKIPASVKAIGEKAIGYRIEYNSVYDDTEYVKVPGFTIDANAGSIGAQYAVAHGFKWVDRDAEKAAAARAAAAKVDAAKAAKVKVKAKALKGKKVKLTWQQVKNASGFEIYQAAKKKGKYKKVATIKKANITKWTSKGLKKVKKGKKVFYKVRVFTKINGKSIYGKWSNIAIAKIKK